MKYAFSIASLLFSSFAFAEIDNVKALKLALDDEYKAKVTYEQVIEDFGPVRPFPNIMAAEQSHIDALIPFFAKYGEEVPANPYVGNATRFNSVREACQAGVEGEIANRTLYEELFEITDDQQLIEVFKNLQWASEYRHLPAFSRCASR